MNFHKLTQEQKTELIGQIIDIFEDDLQERIQLKSETIKGDAFAHIRLHKEDKDCSGVFYGGNFYDKIAVKIEETFKNWL